MNTIENMLPKGERNAVPTEKLLQMVGATSERALRERIAEERKKGAVILSSNRKPGDISGRNPRKRLRYLSAS